MADYRAVDLLRRAGSQPRALARVALEPEEPGKPARPEGAVEEVNVDTDDRLRLIFTCCHPWLPMDARVARTLRTVAGLGSAHIARAKIKNAGIPYRVPPADRLPNAGKECVQ